MKSESLKPDSNVELDEFLPNSDNNDAKDNSFVHKEGDWGWLVTVAAGYCFGILIGSINNYALIYNEFDKVYNGTDNHVFYSAWIGSVSAGIQYMSCSFGSIVTDYFGARTIGLLGGSISVLSLALSAHVSNIKSYFFTYGIGFGIGQALLLTSTFAILPYYFDKRLSLANGVMNLIGAIIVVILPIATDYTLKKFSLFGTFYFLAGLNFFTIIMTLTYKSTFPKVDKKSKNVKGSFGLDIFKKRKFFVWCFGSFLGIFGYLIPILNIDHHSIKTFPDYNPVYINIVFGAMSGISALVFGRIGDLTKFDRVHYHTSVFVIYGIVELTIPFATNFYVLLFQIVILGIMDGIWLCFIVPIAVDLSESTKLANHAAGYYHVIVAPSIVAGPAVAGRIYEIFHSYDLAFYLGGISCLISAVILIIFISGIDLLKKTFKK